MNATEVVIRQGQLVLGLFVGPIFRQCPVGGDKFVAALKGRLGLVPVEKYRHVLPIKGGCVL